jgi:kinesin family protein 2/24
LYKGTKPVTRQTNHYSPAVNGSSEVLSTTVPCTPLNPPTQYQQIPVLKPADPPPPQQPLTNLYSNNIAATNRGANTIAAAAAAAAAKDRRSNVVKEVAKLKKNREERRQRQAELKEEKEALMNMDPGNPNWEFLAMIR